jgi:hypothetical protein
MDAQQKVASFAVIGITWISWVLVGLSMGGLPAVLQRAVYLVTTTRRFREVQRLVRSLLYRATSRPLAGRRPPITIVC